MYCFTHGLPTRNTGSWLPDTDAPACGNRRCIDASKGSWPDMWRRSGGKHSNWLLRKEMECQVCADERKRRHCIIFNNEEASARYKAPPFTDAPFVHPFRHPSYHAQQLRAVHFAKAHNKRILWVTAHDVMKTGNKTTSGEKAELRKERWLEFHDRFTSGIPGV